MERLIRAPVYISYPIGKCGLAALRADYGPAFDFAIVERPIRERRLLERIAGNARAYAAVCRECQ